MKWRTIMAALLLTSGVSSSEETDIDTEMREGLLIYYWLLSELPPAEGECELKYRLAAVAPLSGLPHKLYLAGFRLKGRERSKAEVIVTGLDLLRETDIDAWRAYGDALLDGSAPDPVNSPLPTVPTSPAPR